MSFDRIPAALRERRQWVVWKLEFDERDRLTKVPYRVADLRRRASTTDPRTWASFEDAVQARKLAGPALEWDRLRAERRRPVCGRRLRPLRRRRAL